MQARALACTDLACRRGDRLLFRGLSLDLVPGDALRVTGANGTGKSSLIRILAGLLRPFAGTVHRTGQAGLIDERPALDPGQPLGVALGFWRRLDGPADNAPAHTLATLGLTDLLDVPVRYLSTGQKKRAAFARLIGQAAPIWLLDEPLNGLDVASTQVIGGIVDSHCRAGGICVIASHQPFAAAGARALAVEDFAP